MSSRLIKIDKNVVSVLESAKKEYFERNFAWHAIAQARMDLNVKVDNATIMFIRPQPDGRSKDRLGVMKTTYNLKVNNFHVLHNTWHVAHI